uniref:Uncharacterized protein n=1 Tax=Rangifer tarandus platyrhynchus TaxID=3082113 RepID=A0ACB0FG71_RANTA|nr:unnamed protein product [Rangifer tarandus platyrhynchus]
MHLEEAAPSQGEHAALPPRPPYRGVLCPESCLVIPPGTSALRVPNLQPPWGAGSTKPLLPDLPALCLPGPTTPCSHGRTLLDLRPSPACSVAPHTDQVIPCPFRGLCLLCSSVRFPEGGATSLCFLPGTSETCTEICGQMNE